jgi:predicted AAA+ superfamily ATPase
MSVRPTYIDMVERIAFHYGKMAFVAGPRQVGKTTLARQILDKCSSNHYHACDDPVFRRQWHADPSALVPRRVGERPVIVLDELHKLPRWKNRLKSLHDTRGGDARILVTGSARLDLFRRGGDSLLGRYFLFRMHPFSLGEIEGSAVPPDAIAGSLDGPLESSAGTLDVLLDHGGFPEPFLKRDAAFTNLWRRSRIERLVREDLRDLQRVSEVSLIETAALLLPERVGSLFSMKSLSEELEVSQPTIKRWMEWLSNLYLVYRISPHARNVARSLGKQPKIYLWDWSEVPDPGPRFENLVAGHLLKAAHAWTDTGLGTFDLRFVRDKEKREVDFLLLRNRKPWMLVEAKTSERTPSPHLLRFASQLRPEMTVQLLSAGGVHEWFDAYKGHRGHLVSADSFLRLLP